jgi:DNA-binding transcriptional ArsR family regulator
MTQDMSEKVDMSEYSDINRCMIASSTVGSDVFSALSNPVRRKILLDLRDGERNASEIAGSFQQLKRPAVSEHLQLLRKTGLVREEQRGRHRFYHLNPKPLEEIDQWLRCFSAYWTERLVSLEAVLNEEHSK